MFFQETADELVNRLFKTWIESKPFVNTLPMTDPVMKQQVINRLKEFDEDAQRVIDEETEDYSDNFPPYLTLQREYHALIAVTQLFARGVKKLSTPPPPKPTHRQHRPKVDYLRVVNG